MASEGAPSVNHIPPLVIYEPTLAVARYVTGSVLTNSTPVDVKVVDASGDQVTLFGGGTQYTEGDTDATITGTAAMMEVASNVLQPIQGTVADGLLVNLGANNDISGTVTANLSATDNAVLDAIEADTTTIAGAVSGTEMQVDIVSGSVGVTGTVTINTSGLATSTLQTSGNTSLSTIAGAVAGTEMQVDVVNTPTVTVGTFPDNEPFNLALVNGLTVLTGIGTGAGSQRVAAIQHDGTYAQQIDPCQRIESTKGITAISITTSSQIVTGVASRHTYICAFNIVAAAATNVALVSGTGTVCATNIAGLEGGTTAATGWNFAANSGINRGQGGFWINRTNATGDNLCLLISAANQVSGSIKWAQAP